MHRRRIAPFRLSVKKSFVVSLIALALAESLIAADVSGEWSLRLTTAEADGESAPRASVTL